MVDETAALRVQLVRQVAHWRAAVLALEDLDNFASAAAWASLERYLDVALRTRLRESVDRLAREGDVVAAELVAAHDPEGLERARRRLVAFRHRYLRTETVLEFYGDAVNSRTNPRLAALLSACDVLAARSMAEVLAGLGHTPPPVITYVAKGMGASILRAGLRLWDGGSLSPVAAIKIVRHNLQRPTALIHESGHQVAHMIGWVDELAMVLDRTAAAGGDELARTWGSWSGEITADAFAFCHTGYGSVAALHDVLADGHAFRYQPGDPHPVAYLRVALAVEMCVRSFGSGPWDQLAESWARTHPVDAASPAVRELVVRSLPLIPRLAEVVLRTPLRAFGNRPLVAVVDPARVSPAALTELETAAGGALARSPHWLHTEGLRLLALTSYRKAMAPERATQIAEDQEAWMLRLGGIQAAA
jgi:hypothetical protein